MYITWVNVKQKMPNLQLVAFKRVFIEKNLVLNFLLEISAENMAVWDDNDGYVIEPGNYISVSLHRIVQNVIHL